MTVLTPIDFSRWRAAKPLAVQRPGAAPSLAVYCVTNGRYLIPSIIALQSVRQFHPEHKYFILAAAARLTANERRLVAQHDIELIDHDDCIFADEGHVTREAYWSFFGPDLFAARGFSHSMVIDGDILFVKPLDFTSLLPRVECYAAIDRGGCGRKWTFRYPELLQRLYGIDDDRMNSTYANTGLIIWNNEGAKSYRVFQRATECYRACCRIHPRMFRGMDQSLLALISVLDPALPWHVLPPQFNFRVNSEFERRRGVPIDEIRVLHYTGPKPWRPRAPIDFLRYGSEAAFRHRAALDRLWCEFVERHTVFHRDLSVKSSSAVGRAVARLGYWSELGLQTSMSVYASWRARRLPPPGPRFRLRPG